MKKKVLAAILAATMVVGLTACGGSKDTTTTTPDAATEETTDDAAEAPAADASGMSFEIVSKGLQHQYWQAVKKGVEQKAAELGVTVNFVGPDSETNISQQVQQLESALNANPTAVGLAALDTEAIAVTLDVGHTRAGNYTETLNVTLPDSGCSLMQDVEIQYKLVKRTAADDNKTTGDSSSTNGSTDSKKENVSDAGNDNTTGNSTPDNTAGDNSSGDSAGESKNDSATE